MTTLIKQILVSLLFVASVTLLGCGGLGLVTSVSAGSRYWMTDSEDPIPGIHEGSAEVIGLDNVTVVIWCDRSTDSSSRSSGRQTDVSAEGRIRLPDGSEIVFRAKSENGTTAMVTLDGTAYDSSKGSLLLISTQSERPQVKQVVGDVGDFPTEAKAITDYALGNSEIAGFFIDAKKKSPVEQKQSNVE